MSTISTTKVIAAANKIKLASSASSVIHPPVIQGQIHLTRRDALIRFLFVMGYGVGDTIQVCVNQNRYYQSSVTESGLAITAEYCKWHKTETRWLEPQEYKSFPNDSWEWKLDPNFQHEDGFSYLLQRAKQGDEIFYKANHLVGGISNRHFISSTDIFAEDDERTEAEQWENLASFIEATRIQPTAVVHSGGKSLHIHNRLSVAVDAQKWMDMVSHYCACLESDFAVTTLNRHMRLPGFPRQRKDGSWSEVALLVANDVITSPEDFIKALEQSWVHPYAFNPQRWHKYKSAMARWRHRKNITPLSAPADAFRLSDAVLFPSSQTTTYAEKQSLSEQGTENPWVKFLNDSLVPALEKMPLEQVFSEYPHNLKLANNQLVGRSPWSATNSSGTSFQINTKTGEWFCHASNQGSKSPVQYLQRVWYGRIGRSLSGPDFIEFCKRLADKVGLAIPNNLKYSLAKRKSVECAAYATKPSAEEKNTIEAIQNELNSLRIQPTIMGTGRCIPSGLLHLPSKPGIILIDGAMGVGKTSVVLKELAEEHRNLYPDALQWLFTPRNLLGYQAGKILGLPHHTANKRNLGHRHTSCLESIGLIDLEKIPNAPPIIFFDEVSQSIKQILEGNTCESRQPFIIQQLCKLCRAISDRGGWIVLSEDGLTNLEVDPFINVSGLEVVEFLKFTKTVNHPQLYEVYDSPTQTWNQIEQCLERGENLIIATDSNNWLREIKQRCQEVNIEGTFIYGGDHGNSNDAWVKQFAEDPDAWIAKNRSKCRVIGYTPSLQSGISINDREGWFNAVAFHITHLEPRTAKQLTARLRTDVSRFGYIKKRGHYENELVSSFQPNVLLGNLRCNKDRVAKLIQFAKYVSTKQTSSLDVGDNSADLLKAMQQIDAEWDDTSTVCGFYLKYWSCYKARENYSKSALRKNLMSIWQEQGHQVEFKPLGKIKHQAEERKRIRKLLELKDAMKFASADSSDLTVQEARNLLKTSDITPEQRLRARKRLLEDKLPECPLNNPQFVLKTVIRGEGRFLKATEMLWLSQHPEFAKQLDRWTWFGKFDKAARRNEIVPIHRLSICSAQAKLFNECPLEPFVKGEVQKWSNDSPEAIAVQEWAISQAGEIKQYLGLTIKPEHTPTKIVNKFLRKLGFECNLAKRRGGRGKQVYWYHITNLNDVDRNQILEGLTKHFLFSCDKHSEHPGQAVSPPTKGIGSNNLPLGHSRPSRVEQSRGVEIIIPQRQLSPTVEHCVNQFSTCLSDTQTQATYTGSAQLYSHSEDKLLRQ